MQADREKQKPLRKLGVKRPQTRFKCLQAQLGRHEALQKRPSGRVRSNRVSDAPVAEVCCVLLVILSFHSRWLSGMGGLADVELTFLLLCYRIAVSILRAVVTGAR